MQKANEKKKQRPPQHQSRQPGLEYKMNPRPEFFDGNFNPGNKLKGKVCIITGGDSGIGRAVSVSFAREGADGIVMVYLNEDRDARETLDFITKNFPSPCILLRADIRRESVCRQVAEKTLRKFGHIDVLVNNAAIQITKEKIEKIDAGDLLNTFESNVFSMFYLCKHVVPHLDEGSCIINTASVTAYRGSAHLLDYAASKGAIVSFTRSLASNLASRGIRVNGVAPGPVWTPLVPSSFKSQEVAEFGSDVPLGRAGEPYEIAPSYVFLASTDSSYITGQFLHPNGGEIVNG